MWADHRKVGLIISEEWQVARGAVMKMKIKMKALHRRKGIIHAQPNGAEKYAHKPIAKKRAGKNSKLLVETSKKLNFKYTNY